MQHQPKHIHYRTIFDICSGSRSEKILEDIVKEVKIWVQKKSRPNVYIPGKTFFNWGTFSSNKPKCNPNRCINQHEVVPYDYHSPSPDHYNAFPGSDGDYYDNHYTSCHLNDQVDLSSPNDNNPTSNIAQDSNLLLAHATANHDIF